MVYLYRACNYTIAESYSTFRLDHITFFPNWYRLLQKRLEALLRKILHLVQNLISRWYV